MTTIRIAPRARFTIIPNDAVRDERLSFRARGVLAYLLSHDDDVQVDSTSLSEAGAEGREAIRTAFRELVEFGYMRRDRVQGADGRWTTTVFVYDEPETGFRASVDRASVSRALTEDPEKTEEAKASSRERPVDHVWEWLADPDHGAFGRIPDGPSKARQARNAAVAELRRFLRGERIDLADRGAVYARLDAKRRAYPFDTTLTPHALAKHWPQCVVAGDADGGRVVPPDEDQARSLLAGALRAGESWSLALVEATERYPAVTADALEAWALGVPGLCGLVDAEEARAS